MSTLATEDVTTAASTAVDPTELVDSSAHGEPTTAGSFTTDASGESSGSTFAWEESHVPQTSAPTTTTPAPTTSAPAATTATPVANTSASTNGGSSAVLAVTLSILGLLLLLGIVLFIRRRRRNHRFLAAKFQHDANLGTPTISIELPPPPPSSRLSASQINQQQRASVFSNGRTGGGGSLFNTAAPVVSPTPATSRLAPQPANQGAPFRPDQSTTYRLVDPSPSNTVTPSSTVLYGQQARTPVPHTAPTAYPRPHQPDYGQFELPYHAKPSAATTSSRTMSSASTVSSSTRSQSVTRDTSGSIASTVQGFHDSMCDDLYQYGDGLNRERAASRSERSRSRSRGTASASAVSSSSARYNKPSIVLEIDELVPVAQVNTPKNTSKKTLSLAEMRAGGSAKRAPPPPPPPVSSFFVIQPPSPSLSETEPFNPLMMTSVRVHQQRASEDVVGNSTRGASSVMASSFASSTSSASASAGSASFGSSSFLSASSVSTASSTTTHLQSSHSGHAVEKPTDAQIQRLSDVSSVCSDSSTLRAGSLIELKQVVEMENIDGKAKEIEI